MISVIRACIHLHQKFACRSVRSATKPSKAVSKQSSKQIRQKADQAVSRQGKALCSVTLLNMLSDSRCIKRLWQCVVTLKPGVIGRSRLCARVTTFSPIPERFAGRVPINLGFSGSPTPDDSIHLAQETLPRDGAGALNSASIQNRK